MGVDQVILLARLMLQEVVILLGPVLAPFFMPAKPPTKFAVQKIHPVRQGKVKPAGPVPLLMPFAQVIKRGGYIFQRVPGCSFG